MTSVTPKPVFVSELTKRQEGDLVVLIGQVVAKPRKFKDKFVIRVKDLTKSCMVELPLKYIVKKGLRVRVVGQISFNKEGLPIIKNVESLDTLGNFRDFEVELDARIREQASKMQLSKICDSISQFLRTRHYVKFETDLLSKDWPEQGLEPLQVLFPGFGGPAGLITSPSAQIIDFLISTGVSRAYTISKSFSTTLRYASSRTEVLLVMAKAADIAHDDSRKYIWDLFWEIVNELDIENFTSEYQVNSSPLEISSWIGSLPQLKHKEVRLLCFEDARRVDRDFWTGSIDAVMQIHLDERGVLIEGSRELVGEELQIYSLVVYPSQFLHFLESAPHRSLENLGRFSVWT